MHSYFFGVTSGHLNARAAEIAQEHGAELIFYEEEGDDGWSTRRWCTFACPSQGHPHDQEIADRVKADIESAGGVEALRKRFSDHQEINENWTEEDEESFKEFSARHELKRIIQEVASWDGEDANHIARQLSEAYQLLQRIEKSDWVWIDELEEQLTLTLADRGERDDQSWPSPWDAETCPFAYVVDRQGRYLARSLCIDTDTPWIVREWEAGVTCRFGEGKDPNVEDR